MTRRKFIKRTIKTASVIVAGMFWLAKKAQPRRFVRALKLKGYPGSLGTLRNINKQGKWSG